MNAPRLPPPPRRGHVAGSPTLSSCLRGLHLGGLVLPGLLGLLGVVVVPAPARAHEVETKDGTVYEGKIIVDDDEHVVVLTTFDGRKSVPRADVVREDKFVPPLRDQLAYRADLAKDSVPDLFALYKWAKEKGFEPELVQILERIVEIDPKSARAHKLLGHVKVKDAWMTPDEKAAQDAAAHDAEMRAKGLVPYQGRWVTPEEKDALEKGLVKDGDQWVTEEELHRRRGEKKVDGKWVRVGEAEGKAWLEELRQGHVAVSYRWSPHVDLYGDTDEETTKTVLDGAEAAWRALYQVLAPGPDEMPEGVDGRIRIHVFTKQPGYARFVQVFDGKAKCSEVSPGWMRSAQRQHAFWWVQPIGVVGAYKFPNTTRTLRSNAVHNMGFLLLTQYHFDYRFPPAWLEEGFAYLLEMEAYGSSDTFNLHQQGTAAASGAGQTPWADTEQWRGLLKDLVSQGQDVSAKRLSVMPADQLGYPELAKSWSLLELLYRTDAKKLRAFLAATKDRSKSVEDALKEAYGWTWHDLDEKWHAYVAADFRVT